MVVPARVDQRGGVSLPPEVCRHLGWLAGDELLIEEWRDGVIIRRQVTDGEAMGQIAESLAAEVLPVEDFTGWDDHRG